MSNYMFAFCKTCEVSGETDINHGTEQIKMCAKIVSLAVAIDEKLKDDYCGYAVEISLEFRGTELISFLKDHREHEVWACSEYGIDHESSEKLVIE